ncbi:hypothetical protein WJX74_001794 [Apatococcus lobatus]|uniref:Uncharacterized protein n=1 Tax=Apatococcus lobatus TaxID=904363 RepID=A0AAW1S301_9CHLO
MLTGVCSRLEHQLVKSQRAITAPRAETQPTLQHRTVKAASKARLEIVLKLGQPLQPTQTKSPVSLRANHTQLQLQKQSVLEIRVAAQEPVECKS